MIILKILTLNFHHIFGKFKFKIFLVLFLTLLDTIIVLSSPRIISNIVDNGIITNSRDNIMKNGLYLLLFSILSIIFSLTTTYVAAQVGYGITAIIQKDIFKKLLNFSFKNLDKFATPTILTRITNDSDSIRKCYCIYSKNGASSTYNVHICNNNVI
jgi:ABC superfamily ATP binding cassette transporter, membrane protein